MKKHSSSVVVSITSKFTPYMFNQIIFQLLIHPSLVVVFTTSKFTPYIYVEPRVLWLKREYDFTMSKLQDITVSCNQTKDEAFTLRNQKQKYPVELNWSEAEMFRILNPRWMGLTLMIRVFTTAVFTAAFTTVVVRGGFDRSSDGEHDKYRRRRHEESRRHRLLLFRSRFSGDYEKRYQMREKKN